MGDTIDFVTKFHSLEGNLLGERRRNFSKFLRELASSNDQQIELFFKNLVPQTYLEKLFKIDALIYFKRTSEMMSVITGDNEIYRAKIMKQQWFFESAFKKFDAETLVNDFIPQLPFKDRRKFVKNILRTMDEKQVDLVVAALFKRYGLSLAKHFLHLCSVEKMKYFFQNEEIDLQPNQVMHLFHKNVELFVNYLDYYTTTFNTVYYEQKVSNHIALTNLELLINLHEENKIRLDRLGRRTSKKGFDIMKNGILENKYKTTLNKNVMYRKLGNQFKDYYFYRFPIFYADLSLYQEFSVLRGLPKSKKWPVFSEVFSKRFPNRDIKNIAINDLINHCPDKTIIQTRALEVYNKDKDEKYLQYVEPKLSIPLLKERINVTSDITNRKRLAGLLIKTCGESKDLESLEVVLKYICNRHRNEEDEFRSDILYKIRSLFNLEELNENHWNYINEMIKIKRITKNFYFSTDSAFTEGYLQYLFRNKKDFAGALQEYAEDIIQNDYLCLMNVKDPELLREIFVEFLKSINHLKTSTKLDYKIISCIVKFNELYPEHRIAYSTFDKFNQRVPPLFAKTENIQSDESNLIEKLILHKIRFPDFLPNIDNAAIRQIILNVALQSTNGKLLSSVFKAYILKKFRTKFEDDLFVVYFEQLFNKYPVGLIINWFLLNEPQAIVIYFPKILFHSSRPLFSLELRPIKYYSHFMFDKQIIDYLTEKVASVPYQEKFYYIRDLKIFLTTDEFVQIVMNQYLPEKEKIDLTDKKMMDVYKLQCDIAKILHKVEEPHKMLQIVFKFCLGDYLQSALPSLYGIFYKSSEIKLYSWVEMLSKRAVSVNKHAVFLSCAIFTQDFIINILGNTKHTNVSSQKHLFSAALKYFQKNPSETLLNIVIGTMSTIDKNDNEALCSLIDATVPKRFKVPYIEKCWTFYENLERQEVNVTDYLTSILRNLSNNLSLLKNVSSAFITNILKSYLLSKKVHNIMKFAAKVLVYREQEQTENFDLVFKIMSTKTTTQTRPFLELFAEEKIDLKFISLLDKYWHQYLTLTDNFWGHIFLKLWLIAVEKESEEKFAEGVVTFLEQVMEEYGSHSFSLFQNVFSRFLENKKTEYKYKLFCNILKFKTTASTCILILNTMSPVTAREYEHIKIFQNIMDIIKNVKEPIVSIYYRKYLCDHDISIPLK